MKRIVTVIALALYMLLLASSAGAQAASSSSAASQSSSSGANQPSLGDYARKIRKDTGTKEKPKVYDNDNLPAQDKLSVVGPKPESSTAADNKNSENKTGDKTADDAKQAQWKEWQGKLTAQKDEINLASRELDVLQREYELRAAAMYGDAGNRLRNEAQWDKQDAEYKQKIADKQKSLEDAKQKLSDMQEDARKAGVPSSMIDQ